MTRAPYDPREILPPCSEILPHLFLGMRPRTYIGYALIVSCEEHLARRPMENYDGIVVHFPMRDEDEFFIHPERVGYLARMIANVHASGDRVLVHCTGGLNRSAVVMARALELIGPMTGREAVDLMRKRRDPFVLCNRPFERWVTGEVLPTAETSAFRLQ